MQKARKLTKLINNDLLAEDRSRIDSEKIFAFANFILSPNSLKLWTTREIASSLGIQYWIIKSLVFTVVRLGIVQIYSIPRINGSLLIDKSRKGILKNTDFNIKSSGTPIDPMRIEVICGFKRYDKVKLLQHEDFNE